MEDRSRAQEDKAIVSTWECRSCGNRIELGSVLVNNKAGTKYSFDSPKKCVSCGSDSGFTLQDFESGYAIIKKTSERQQR